MVLQEFIVFIKLNMKFEYHKNSSENPLFPQLPTRFFPFNFYYVFHKSSFQF